MGDWLKRSIEAFDHENELSILRLAYSDPKMQTSVVIDDMYGAKNDDILAYLEERPLVNEVRISSHYEGVHSADKINGWLHASEKITYLSIFCPLPWVLLCKLDLSGLTKLCVSIAGEIGQERLSAPNLESLSLFAERDEEISPLEEMLIEKKVHDFSGMPNLHSVDLHYWKTLHFSSLKSLRYLKYLRVYDCGLSNLTWLSSSYQLEKLYINTGICDLSGIETQKNLKNLDLSHSNLQDISLLSSCLTLINLNLRDNNIKDLSPLNTLKSLVFVDATRNPICSEGTLRSNGIETLLITEEDKDDHAILAKVYGLVHKAAQNICWENNTNLDKMPDFLRKRIIDNRKKSIQERLKGWIQSSFNDTIDEISPYSYNFCQYTFEYIRKFVFLSKKEYPFLTIGDNTNERIQRLTSTEVSSRKPIPGRLVFCKENLVDVHARVKRGTGKLWLDISDGHCRDKGQITKSVQKQLKQFMPYISLACLDIEVTLIGYFDKPITVDIAGAITIAIHSAIYKRAIKPGLAFSFRINERGIIIKTEPSNCDVSTALLYGFSSVVCYSTNKTLRTEGNVRISYTSVEEMLKGIYLDQCTYQRLNEMSDFENELFEMLQAHRAAIVDRVRLRGLLQDCFPHKKQIINLMLLLVNMQFLEEVERQKTCDDLMIQRYANRLEQEYGVTSEAALCAARAWGLCYGKYILDSEFSS